MTDSKTMKKGVNSVKMNIMPLILYRKAALPVNIITGFGTKNLPLLVERLLQQEREIVETIDQLVAHIEVHVRDSETDLKRKKLINLKRHVFNRRRKSIEKENEDLLEDESIFLYRNYVELYQSIANIKQDVIAEYEQLTDSERHLLYETFINDKNSIAKSLKFIQPHMIRNVNKYFEVPVDKHNGKIRKLDVTLSKVLTRASLKTSPFSTLTYTGFKELTTNNENHSVENKTKQSITKINESYIFRIFEKAIQTPEVLLSIDFQMIPTISVDDQKVYWTILVDNQEERGKIYRTQDRLVTMNKSHLISSIIDRFYHKERFVYQEFKQLLQQLQVPESQHQAIFYSLYGQQLFTPKIALKQNTDCIITECIRVLSDFSNSKIQVTIQILQKIKNELTIFDQKDYKDQQQAFDRIWYLLNELCDQLALERMEKSRMLYQDAIEVELGEADAKKWELEYESLYRLMKFLTVFDVSYIIKKRMAAGFIEQFGYEEVNMENNWEEVIRTLLDHFLNNIHIWANQFISDTDHYDAQEINQQNKVKTDFINHLTRQLKQDSQEIHLDLNYIDEQISRIPKKLLNRRQSNSFFVQRNENDLILNHFYEGNLTYFSRFLKLNPALQDNEQLNSYIDEAIKKYNYCDVDSTYGFNANSRIDVTGKRIQLLHTPEIGSSKDHVRTYEWKDLTFRVNKDSDEIEIFYKEEKINISFFGTLMPMLLPGIVSAMSILSSNIALYNDFHTLIMDLVVEEMSNKNESLRKVPRLIFNDNIILSRKKWIMKTDEFHAIFLNNHPNYIEKLLVFLIENDLPIKCFVYNYDAERDINLQEKPQYIDFTSPSLLKLFNQMFIGHDYIVLEEILPDITEEKEEAYVTEYILEITREGKEYANERDNNLFV